MLYYMNVHKIHDQATWPLQENLLCTFWRSESKAVFRLIFKWAELSNVQVAAVPAHSFCGCFLFVVAEQANKQGNPHNQEAQAFLWVYIFMSPFFLCSLYAKLPGSGSLVMLRFCFLSFSQLLYLEYPSIQWYLKINFSPI